MNKIVCFLLLFLPLFIKAQNPLSPKTEKELEAAVELFNKGSRQKGIEKTRQIVYAHSDVTELWNLLAKMYKQDLEIAKQAFNKSMNKSIEDVLRSLEKEKKGDKTKKADNSQMMDALGPYISAQMAYENYLREATLKSRSTVSSMYLRAEKIDGPKPDSLVGFKAREAFNKAEKLFNAGNYTASIPLYREAIALAESPYFSAELYLGDAYYMLKDYDSAQKYFSTCAAAFPRYIEPHKYLADCYGKQYEFDKAVAACSEAIFVYPDASMFMKLEDCAGFLRKKYNDGWLARGCYPHSVKNTQNIVPGHGIWADYQTLSKNVWAQSDSLGIINDPAKFDGETYAEVYVWKKLLEQNPDHSGLAFARNMQQRGYLDCYVFVSLFHYDLYPTYRHFIDNRKEKATAYLRDVVIYK